VRPAKRHIDVGDFVYCRSAYHREQLGLPKEAALVLENKRNNYRLLYGTDKSCWLPGPTLTRVEGEVNLRTLGGKLHGILKRLRPLDCEVVSDDGIHRATLRIDRIDAPLLDELREFLGSDFVSLEIVPEGMAFMLAEVRFRA
jgi:hypothetical protein